MPNPLFINLADLAGVDDETFQKADRGDRQAQKVMMRNLLTQEASAEALTTQHWTHWMLRMIATGGSQAISDVLGSIAEAARKGQLSKAQHSALNELFEQYFGPGTVGAPAEKQVLAAFKGKQRETRVLKLFLLADLLASGDPSVTAHQVWAAVSEAEALGAAGVEAFFRAVWAEMTFRDDPVAAFEAGLDAAKLLEPLAEQDEVYEVKLGQLAMLAAQIADFAGEQAASTLMRVTYYDAIAKFQASQREA